MDTKGSASAPARRRVSAKVILAGVAALAILSVAFVQTVRATEQPSFCGSACHEMGPYHEAWSKGPHKNIACIECHVDEGTVARMEHKVVALKEVADHVTGAPKFPLTDTAPVPNERCKRCHPKVSVNIPGFSHADHQTRGTCVSCHSDAGHTVTVEALKRAGIYNTSAAAATDTAKPATINAGQANLPGHVSVSCSRCHDMAATKCSACHTPKHEARGECATCHATGIKFVFTHPQLTDCGACHKAKNPKHTWTAPCTTCHRGTPGSSFAFTHPATGDCTSCHARPAGHKPGSCTSCHHNRGVNWAFAHPTSSASCESCHPRPANHKAGACQNCHHNAGTNWAFAHPGSGANCVTCHARPANHKPGACTTCHKKPGKSWAFAHPGASANCASCHPRPANHKSGSCNTCHKAAGKSWAFSHPGAGANCASCHARPAGHSGGACQSCHSPGSKWVFHHPSSSSCASCHSAPSGHYGTNCASCHSPSRAWLSATFSHPRIPGGEHTYKSFACTKCHSSGRGPAYFCSCHGNTTGPKGD